MPKLYKCNANIYFNQECLCHNFTPVTVWNLVPSIPSLQWQNHIHRKWPLHHKCVKLKCIKKLKPRGYLTWLFGKVPSLSIALTWVTLVPIGSPSRTVSCSRSVKRGISSFTSSSMMKTVASEASCCAPLFCKTVTKLFVVTKNTTLQHKESLHYRGADKSLAWPTSWYILFDG